MRAVVHHRSMSAKEERDWNEEQRAWGITLEPEQPVEIALWSEHLTVIEWWLSIPDFLRFENRVCLGMNVANVHADTQLSGKQPAPEDYQKLKLIARTLAEELNDSRS